MHSAYFYTTIIRTFKRGAKRLFLEALSSSVIYYFNCIENHWILIKICWALLTGKCFEWTTLFRGTESTNMTKGALGPYRKVWWSLLCQFVNLYIRMVTKVKQSYKLSFCFVFLLLLLLLVLFSFSFCSVFVCSVFVFCLFWFFGFLCFCFCFVLLLKSSKN